MGSFPTLQFMIPYTYTSPYPGSKIRVQGDIPASQKYSRSVLTKACEHCGLVNAMRAIKKCVVAFPRFRRMGKTLFAPSRQIMSIVPFRRFACCFVLLVRAHVIFLKRELTDVSGLSTLINESIARMETRSLMFNSSSKKKKSSTS